MLRFHAVLRPIYCFALTHGQAISTICCGALTYVMIGAPAFPVNANGAARRGCTIGLIISSRVDIGSAPSWAFDFGPVAAVRRASKGSDSRESHMTINGTGPSAKSHQEPSPAALPGARHALILLLAINLFNYIDRYVLAAVEPDIRRQLLPG